MGGPDKSGLSFGTTYTLSAISACIAETSTFPFDMVKTRLMIQGETLAKDAATSATANQQRGLVDMARGISRDEGIQGFYRGLAPACLRHVIYSGTRVMAYEVLRERVLMKDKDGNFALWKGVIAGMSAGILGQAVASPTDLVKVQMQADGKRVLAGHQPRYSGIGNAFATIARQGGIAGLWKGVVPNCQRAALVQLGDLTACGLTPSSWAIMNALNSSV